MWLVIMVIQWADAHAAFLAFVMMMLALICLLIQWNAARRERKQTEEMIRDFQRLHKQLNQRSVYVCPYHISEEGDIR